MVVWLVVAVLHGAAFAAANAPVGPLGAWLEQQLPANAHWALAVVDLASGRQAVIGPAATAPLAPASLAKLFTAGAVLEQVGRTGRPELTTIVAHDGAVRAGALYGNLYLRGTGNPLLTTDDLRQAVKRLAALGIRRIDGDLIVDATHFTPQGLERSRTGPAHAPAGALGLDLHTVALTVTPAAVGQAPTVSVEPHNEKVRLAVEARTAPVRTSTLAIRRIDDRAYRVTGNVPPGAAAQKQRFSLQSPELYAGETLATLLRQQGIETAGTVHHGATPPSATVLALIRAPAMAQLVGEMNLNSVNVLADNLLLALGAERFGTPGTLTGGIRAVNEFMASLGLPVEGVTVGDGSGLAAGNRVTAGFVAGYLQKASRQPWSGILRDSLPRAGIEGTAREIGYHDDRFRVKTGQLEDVYALAGYGVNGAGRDLAFAFIVNAPGAARMDLQRCGAEVMRYLAVEGKQ